MFMSLPSWFPKARNGMEVDGWSCGGQGEVSGKDVEEKPQKAPPRLPPWTAQRYTADAAQTDQVPGKKKGDSGKGAGEVGSRIIG